MASSPDLAERWMSICGAHGFAAAAARSQGDLIIHAHSEPHRHYHTANHLRECFQVLDSLAGLADADRVAVEFGLWFHDLVYEPEATDNESRSAEVAEQWLSDQGFEAAEAVAELILATAGHVAADPSDQLAAMLDIDLSILGADTVRYDEYSRQIRREYQHVSDEAFAVGRRAVLSSLLEREPIYVRADVRERLEIRARENMSREMEALSRRA